MANATAMFATVLMAVALAACGSSSSSITKDASNRLQLQVEAVRNAAVAHDRSIAEARLAELRRSVAELRNREEINSDRATKILDAAADVEAQLQTIPTTTTTTTAAPTAPSVPARGGSDNGKGNKGKEGGKD